MIRTVLLAAIALTCVGIIYEGVALNRELERLSAEGSARMGADQGDGANAGA